jgi:hypothetical protein
MVNRTAFWWLTGIVFPLLACGSTGGATHSKCKAGEAVACACPGGTAGQQVCSGDGLQFGACDCPAVAAVLPQQSGPEPQQSGPEGQGTGPQVPLSVQRLVGARCETGPDCGPGLLCLSAASNDFFGNGGPSGGYCSANCTTNADCETLDPDSTCIGSPSGGQRLCLRTCLSLPAAPGERKCLDRTDVPCISAAASDQELPTGGRQEGLCLPICTSDADCPGRYCHPGAGVCRDEPAAGVPNAGSCERDEECAGGLCQELRIGGGICSQFCRYSAVTKAGCGFGEEATTQRTSACLAPYVQASHFSEGEGDVGTCHELCDADEDCTGAAVGWTCRADQDVASQFGRQGRCAAPRPAAPDAGAPVEEPDADAP